MKRIIRRKNSGYALGFTLCSIGLIVLFAVLWKAWLNLSASLDVSSDLWSYLWTEHFEFAPGVGLKLMHLTIVGLGVFILGIIILALSRQVFSITGEPVLLQCPFCKNHWRASRAKGWAECPHCRQFIQPEVMKKEAKTS